jgi:uracil-DNA glycosylase family 4
MAEHFDMFSKDNRFDDLVESVHQCDLCPRLASRKKVLSSANGNLNSKVLFIAEAPGRLGADRTGIPLYGDRTGDNFERLLGNVSWKREQVFITNAVLCNPRENNGNNGTPSLKEISNCQVYLQMVINLIKPEVIVTLGATALKALNLIRPHGVQLNKQVANPTLWNGYSIFPLYHPGPRALIHRPLAKQTSDFMILAKFVHPITGVKLKKISKTNIKSSFIIPDKPIQQVAQAILESCGRMTFFKLTKLMYLVDFNAHRKLGYTVGSEIYIRQVDGPWAPRLNESLETMDGFEVRRFFIKKLAMIDVGPSPRVQVDLDNEILEIISEISEKYGKMSNSEIKTVVYSTEPMRFILREEKKGKDFRNKAVLYKEKTILDL